jgi:hypothetical protein
MDVLKNDFGEVDEATFLGVERPCEIIFFILNIEKSDFEIACVVLSWRMALRTHNMPSGRLKKRLW